jgi:hypothetical protein
MGDLLVSLKIQSGVFHTHTLSHRHSRSEKQHTKTVCVIVGTSFGWLCFEKLRSDKQLLLLYRAFTALWFLFKCIGELFTLVIGCHWLRTKGPFLLN